MLIFLRAGMSAKENRWVKLSELAPQLCALSSDLGLLSPEEVRNAPPCSPSTRRAVLDLTTVCACGPASVRPSSSIRTAPCR